MAITKNFTTPQGVLTSYHEIVRVELNVQAQCVCMYLNCYTSQADKQAGASPVWQECVVIPNSEFSPSPLDAYYNKCISYANSTFNGGTNG